MMANSAADDEIPGNVTFQLGFYCLRRYPFMERAIKICYVDLLYTFYLAYYLSDLFEERAKQAMNIPSWCGGWRC